MQSKQMDELDKVHGQLLLLKQFVKASKSKLSGYERVLDHAFRLIKAKVENGTPLDEAGVYQQDVANQIVRSGGVTALNNDLKKLHNFLEPKLDEWEQFLASSGHRERLVIDKAKSDDPIRSKEVRIVFRLKPIDGSGDFENQQLLDVHKATDSIEYVAVPLYKPYPWTKPFVNFKLVGNKRWGYVMLPILVFIVCLLAWLAAIFIFPRQLIYSVPALTAVSALSFMYFKPLVQVMFSGCVPLEWFMSRFLEFPFVYRCNSDIEGEQIREIRVSTFSATCPICKSRVDIEQGSGPYKHRLIGKCLTAPMEHQFTFDHSTLKGERIN